MSFNLALVAVVDDAMSKKSITEDDASAIMDGVAKWGNFFADQSYVKNIGDALAAVKGDYEAVTRFIGNYPQQAKWRLNITKKVSIVMKKLLRYHVVVKP